MAGRNPFAGLTVDAADIRRACEVQARGHLLHLREGYIETRGRADALAVLIVRSAPRLRGAPRARRAARRTPGRICPDGIAHDVVKLADVSEISNDEARRIFPAYLDAVERLVQHVDGWGR